jgi:hypothetical protein
MSRVRSLLSLVFAGVLSAAEPAPAPGTPAPAPKLAEKSQWVFSLLPKSFQKNPLIDLTVITEMTPLGRLLPAVSPAAPAYFITQSAGFNQRGHAPGNEHTLAPESVERLLTRALAASGYLPSSPEHPASLVIIYTWGSHNLLVEGDADNPTLSANLVARNLLDRAALVGGEQFAAKLLRLFEQADSLANAGGATVAPGGEAVVTPAMMEFTNPVAMFRRESGKNDFLVEQTANDVYYVVASAYDYAALTRKIRRLYWRTRMTVAAQGVSQEQTLPTLIASAGPYFGKDMGEPEILSKKATPEGKVQVGEAVVVEVAPAPAPAKKSAPSKKP